MTTVSKLSKILQVMESLGKGEEFVYAAHDKIMLLPPDTFELDGPEHQLMEAAGCSYDDSEDGYYVYC